MPTSNLEKFTSFVMSDETLRERVASASNLDNAAEIAMQIAEEKGYSLSIE